MDRKSCLSQVSKLLTKDQVDHLTQLYEEVIRIESYFKEYDFAPGVEANRFETFVKMVNSFFTAFVENEKMVEHPGGSILSRYSRQTVLTKNWMLSTFVPKRKGNQ